MYSEVGDRVVPVGRVMLSRVPRSSVAGLGSQTGSVARQ